MDARTKTLVANWHDHALRLADKMSVLHQHDPEISTVIVDTGKTGGLVFLYDGLQRLEQHAKALETRSREARTAREEHELHQQAAGVLAAADIIERLLWETSRA